MTYEDLIDTLPKNLKIDFDEIKRAAKTVNNDKGVPLDPKDRQMTIRAYEIEEEKPFSMLLSKTTYEDVDRFGGAILAEDFNPCIVVGISQSDTPNDEDWKLLFARSPESTSLLALAADSEAGKASYPLSPGIYETKDPNKVELRDIKITSTKIEISSLIIPKNYLEAIKTGLRVITTRPTFNDSQKGYFPKIVITNTKRGLIISPDKWTDDYFPESLNQHSDILERGNSSVNGTNVTYYLKKQLKQETFNPTLVASNPATSANTESKSGNLSDPASTEEVQAIIPQIIDIEVFRPLLENLLTHSDSTVRAKATFAKILLYPETNQENIQIENPQTFQDPFIPSRILHEKNNAEELKQLFSDTYDILKDHYIRKNLHLFLYDSVQATKSGLSDWETFKSSFITGTGLGLTLAILILVSTTQQEKEMVFDQIKRWSPESDFYDSIITAAILGGQKAREFFYNKHAAEIAKIAKPEDYPMSMAKLIAMAIMAPEGKEKSEINQRAFEMRPDNLQSLFNVNIIYTLTAQTEDEISWAYKALSIILNSRENNQDLATVQAGSLILLSILKNKDDRELAIRSLAGILI